MVVGKIRSNILTDGNIRALVKVVDEQIDGVAQEQRTRLETIEDELEDVKRKLGRIWHFVETTDIDMADASERIKQHRKRQEGLEDAAADARAILSQRRAVLDDVNTISAYAQDMSEFLRESELTEAQGPSSKPSSRRSSSGPATPSSATPSRGPTTAAYPERTLYTVWYKSGRKWWAEVDGRQNRLRDVVRQPLTLSTTVATAFGDVHVPIRVAGEPRPS